MDNKRAIIVLSHCILNEHSKLESANLSKPNIIKLISYLLKKNIGIIQLPCPEVHMYGIKRWGHVKEQFDTPFFRQVSRDLIKDLSLQIKEYIKNDYLLVGIVGIEGSPSCGAFKSCMSKEWGGEFKDIELVRQKVSTIIYRDVRGVFMEEVENVFTKMDIQPKFFGLIEGLIDELIKDIDSYLTEINFK